jgi:6,7-dimethyl-8-ribityllumazine synthase
MGAQKRDVVVVDVPGAFELPLAARAAAESERFDAIVALGAVIRGETDHYEHIAREAASGLAAVARRTRVPVGFGVLTVAEEAQALARSAPGPENKGGEAARAAVAMVHVLARMKPATPDTARRGRAQRTEERKRSRRPAGDSTTGESARKEGTSAARGGAGTRRRKAAS